MATTAMELAATNAARCAAPNSALTEITSPVFEIINEVSEPTAAIGPLPSRTANIAAVDRSQFVTAHNTQTRNQNNPRIRPASAMPICEDAHTELAIRAAPAIPTIEARAKDTRKKWIATREPNTPWLDNVSISSSCAIDLTVAALPNDASTIQATITANVSRAPASVKRSALPSKIRLSARAIRIGCPVPSRNRLTAFTGRLFKYSTANITTRNHAAAAKLHRQTISASGMEGRRKMRLNPVMACDRFMP